MVPRTAKYTPVNGGGPHSPRDSISLDHQMEKMSCAERMQVSEQKRSAKASILFQLTAPWLVSVVLALTNLLWLWGFLKQQRPRGSVSHQSWMPPDISKSLLFEFKTLYGTGLNNESETAWNALMPVGRGFVVIKNDTVIPDQPGLNQSVVEQKAMVSVFHQLHCLVRAQYMTREGYYSALEGNPGQVSSAHLMHCFDYLRQTIMCFADTTLEWLPAPPKDMGSTGWGFEHKCRDFDAISRWVEDNRLKTTHGIH
ncbi:Oxidase ustYa [Beauveria bassiana]|nr:Oxidase ustYa [Beauveria bassiana]